MKKLITLLLTVATVLLCSCKATDTTDIKTSYNFETDVPYFYRTGDVINPIAISPDGYYFIGDFGVVIYMDKNTMEGTPLCNKPNCDHTDRETCNAYISKSIGYFIQYYKGYIYTLNEVYNADKQYYEPILARYNLDGTGFKSMTNPINLSEAGSVADCFIHRGYFYYSTFYGIYRLSMDNLKGEAENLYKAENAEEECNNIHSLNAYGNYLYFEPFEINDEGETEEINYSLNLKTLELKKLADNVAGFFNDRLITAKGDPDKDKIYYRVCDLDGGNSRKYETLPIDDELRFDPLRKLHYVQINNDSIFPEKLTAYDSKGKEIYSTGLPKNSEISFTPQDENYFFEIRTQEDKNGKAKKWLWYAGKTDVGNELKFKKLCKLSWAKIELPGYITVE
ncbi:MAG: hypothetical protein ACI4Q8_03455 [Ruminococcus sp.]